MKPKNKKWNITLPAVLVIGLLLFLVVGGVYFSHYVEGRIYEERTDQLNEITSQVYANLNNSLNVHWIYLTFATNMLEGYEPDTIQDIAAYIGEMEHILETESRGSRFVMLDSQGNVYDTSGYRGLWPDVDRLASEEDRYSFISDSYIYEGNYWKFVEKLSTPIHVREDDVSLTYIALLKNMEAVISYYDNGAYGGHNETYILKSDGTRMNEGLFQERMIESYNVIDALEQMDGQRYPDIRAALEETNMLISNFIYDGEEYYYCITSLDPHEAYLLFLIPARYVATETVEMVSTVVRTLLVLVAILLILMVITVAAVLRHRSSARMALQEQANRLQQEELNARLEESNTLLAESKMAVEQSLKSAEEANKAKSYFLSNMSHEIRTPINAVLGMNEMILRECADESLLSYAANIQSSGKTLLFLINDILDMSKIESGKMEIVPVEYETADLILDLWNVIYLRAHEKGLTVDFILDDTLPRMLFGDDVRIKQIVTNLLTNAVKYTSKGGIELRANYKRTEEDTMDLIISVKDTGMGIRQEDMGKLFESFQRIEEEKNRNIEGTGLGMNIVMSLLRLMDGDIKVDSEYQKGSTFTVTIPQKIISDEATGDFKSIMGKQRSGAASNQKSFTAPGANILVVDDNTMNLAVFGALLKRTKMNIVTADSGMKCLETVKEQPFDIIFMDHMMPEMDGIETLHEMQKLEHYPNEETPVIALTANAFAGAKEMYLKEGFENLLTKPIDANLLEQMILSYLPEELVEITEQTVALADGTEASVYELPESLSEVQKSLETYDISLKNGLSLVKGEMEMYLDIVDLFLKDRKRQDAMQQLITEQNMEEYSISVHSIKGTARALGADRFADIAYEHELKSKAGEIEYVKAHWDELIAAWDNALNGLQEFYSSYRAEDDKYGMVNDNGGEVLKLSQSDLDEVVALLEDFETDEAIEKLRNWIGSPLEQGMHERIKNALIALEDEFDEYAAIELLKEEGR